jgi:hypothetical protein
MNTSQSHLSTPDGAHAAVPEAEQAPTDYRLYLMGADGHIRHAVTLDCVNDRAAIEIAEGHRDTPAMELWQRDRLVRRFERTAP